MVAKFSPLGSSGMGGGGGGGMKELRNVEVLLRWKFAGRGGGGEIEGREKQLLSVVLRDSLLSAVKKRGGVEAFEREIGETGRVEAWLMLRYLSPPLSRPLSPKDRARDLQNKR